MNKVFRIISSYARNNPISILKLFNGITKPCEIIENTYMFLSLYFHALMGTILDPT